MNDYKSLFTPRQSQDQRVFTAEVMQKVHQLTTGDFTWRVFARWAFPTLVLSLGGLMMAIQYTVPESQNEAEYLVLSDSDEPASMDWVVDEVANS